MTSRFSILWFSLAASLAACEATTTPAGGAAAAAGGTITYSSPADEIHVYDVGSRSDTQVFEDGTEPDRAPDGTIVFTDVKALGQPGKLATIDANGGGESVIVEPGSTVASLNAVVSPDGTKIAFTYYPRDFAKKLANANGVAVVARTGGAVLSTIDGVFDPVWTPDGRLVVAGTVDVPSGNGEGTLVDSPKAKGLFVSDADLATVTAIPGTFVDPKHPSVSPDGKLVAYSDGDDIWVIGIDGSAPHAVTTGDNVDTHPTFSPDGASVALESYGYVAEGGTLYTTIAVVSAQGPAVDLKNTADAFLVDQNGKRLNAYQHLAWR
jgi:hypothetical protein